jgi:hypothetical protein
MAWQLGEEEWGRAGFMMGVLVSTKTINGVARGLAQLHRIVPKLNKVLSIKNES